MISEIDGSLKASVGGKSHIHTADRVDLSSDGDINDDPFSKMFKKILIGQLNPIPGI